MINILAVVFGLTEVAFIVYLVIYNLYIKGGK